MIPGQEDPLEKQMATNFSILAWEIPRTEEHGGLQSMRLQKSKTHLRDRTTIKQLINGQQLYKHTRVLKVILEKWHN